MSSDLNYIFPHNLHSCLVEFGHHANRGHKGSSLSLPIAYSYMTGQILGGVSDEKSLISKEILLLGVGQGKETRLR